MAAGLGSGPQAEIDAVRGAPASGRDVVRRAASGTSSCMVEGKRGEVWVARSTEYLPTLAGIRQGCAVVQNPQWGHNEVT
jgi:hypothetical protein